MTIIRKTFQIQKFFSLDNKRNITPENLNEKNNPKSHGIKDEYSEKIHNLLPQSKENTNILDFFKLPEFHDVIDLIGFFEQIDDELVLHYKAQGLIARPEFEKNITLAFNKTMEELAKKEWFQIEKHITTNRINGTKDFLQFFSGIKKEADKNAKTHYDLVLILRNMKNIYQIAIADFATVNYEKNFIEYTDSDFFEKIREIFIKNEIFENINIDESDPSSKTHFIDINATATIDGRKFPFHAIFWEKSLNRVLSKMNSNEKYGNIEFLRDLHRGRIETKHSQDALRIAKILFHELGENMEAEVKWGWMKFEDIDGYRKEYIEATDKNFDTILKYTTQKGKKQISGERQEFRLSRAYMNEEVPGVELQFVPYENHNETGFSHHVIYEMKWEISEILANYPRIYDSMIRNIIRHFMEKGKDYKDNILDLNENNIYEHIIKTLELVEISEFQNPQNIKDKAFTSLGNIKKYPTLFRKAGTTYVSAKKFFNQINYWIPTRDYLELHYIEQEIKKIISENEKYHTDLLSGKTDSNQENDEYLTNLHKKSEALRQIFNEKKKEIKSR